METLRKARQSYTTQQKDKATQLAQSSYFEKIAASGGTRNLYHQLPRLCSYQSCTYAKFEFICLLGCVML